MSRFWRGRRGWWRSRFRDPGNSNGRNQGTIRDRWPFDRSRAHAGVRPFDFCRPVGGDSGRGRRPGRFGVGGRFGADRLAWFHEGRRGGWARRGNRRTWLGFRPRFGPRPGFDGCAPNWRRRIVHQFRHLGYWRVVHRFGRLCDRCVVPRFGCLRNWRIVPRFGCFRDRRIIHWFGRLYYRRVGGHWRFGRSDLRSLGRGQWRSGFYHRCCRLC